MRLAIRAEGGGNIGMGHLVRCGAVARAWEYRGHEYCFFTRGTSLPFLRAQGLAARALPPCGSVSEETEAFIDLARAWNADCALLDSYELTEGCYAAVHASCVTAVIDDNARVDYAADILINANLYADTLDYSSCDVSCFLLGGRYAMLREQFQNTPPAPFHETASRILIIMGGADINNYTPRVLAALGDIPDITLTTVVGPAVDNLEAVRRAVESCRSAALYHDPANVAALFASCDIAIATPSTTTFELCAMGIPSILIKQADNQRLIHDYFARTGGMIALGDYTAVTAEAMAEAVSDLLRDTPTRCAMRKTLISRVNRHGALCVTDALAAGAYAERRSV